MAGTIQTVRGPVSPELLGKTMTHEHLLWDQTCWWPGDPDEITFRHLVHEQVRLENRGWVYYNAHRSLDNIVQYDLELAIVTPRLAILTTTTPWPAGACTWSTTSSASSFQCREPSSCRAISSASEPSAARSIVGTSLRSSSHKMCVKICLLKYGGWGYAHILRNMVPFMRAEGISSDSLEMILVANPRRMLTL